MTSRSGALERGTVGKPAIRNDEPYHIEMTIPQNEADVATRQAMRRLRR